MRPLYLMAAAAIVSLTSSASAADEKAERFMKCAKVCAECQLQCDSCFKHCLMLVKEGQKEHAETAQMCVDCAECCKACATLCARQSPLAAPMLKCCAECCDQCAEACEKYPDDEHMAACAKKCRECSKECRELLKHLEK